jgi:hypothetical protein
MSIEPLSPAVRDYFRAFDLTTIAVTAYVCIRGTRNPAGAEAAGWCVARDASSVIPFARKHCGTIPAAAGALGVALSDHAAGPGAQALARIEADMAWGQRSGVLHEFNQVYRRRP